MSLKRWPGLVQMCSSWCLEQFTKSDYRSKEATILTGKLRVSGSQGGLKSFLDKLATDLSICFFPYHFSVAVVASLHCSAAIDHGLNSNSFVIGSLQEMPFSSLC